MKKHNYKKCQCCACKSKRGESFGKKSSNYKHGETLIKHYCSCGEELSDYRAKRCKFCYSKIQKISMQGKNNPAWKENKPKCKSCGKEITSRKYKRCSICYIEYMIKYPHNKGIRKSKTWKDKISSSMKENGTTKGKNNPMFGRITHGKGSYYKKIWMRSSYEIAFVKWLDRKGIRWQYEPKTFDLGEMTYTPDFYLPEFNLYIEVKGYWRDDAKLKFEKFKQRYCGIRIKIVNKEELKENNILKEDF